MYLLHINKTVDKEALSPSKALTTSALTKKGFEVIASCFLYQQQNKFHPVPHSAWASSLCPAPTAVNCASLVFSSQYFQLHLWNYVQKMLGRGESVVLLWFLTKALSRSAAEVATGAVQLFSVQLFTVQLLYLKVGSVREGGEGAADWARDENLCPSGAATWNKIKR